MSIALARVADGGRRPGRLPLRALIPAKIPLRFASRQHATVMPLAIDLGTCVLVSLDDLDSDLTEPGVVIAVVPAGRHVITPRATPACSLSSVDRFVVQCWACRVVRRAAQMEVVCL